VEIRPASRFSVSGRSSVACGIFDVELANCRPDHAPGDRLQPDPKFAPAKRSSAPRRQLSPEYVEKKLQAAPRARTMLALSRPALEDSDAEHEFLHAPGGTNAPIAPRLWFIDKRRKANGLRLCSRR
jgi:hypothetical protein